MNEELEKSKQYDDWNEKKKLIEQDRRFRRLYFKESDIWWCSLGKNIGTESFGKGENFRRPIIILKKLSAEMCIALPITTQRKEGSWFVEISFQGEKRWVLLHQIRMVHVKRFQRHMAEITSEDMFLVKEKLKTLLELSLNHHPTEVRIEGETPKT